MSGISHVVDRVYAILNSRLSPEASHRWWDTALAELDNNTPREALADGLDGRTLLQLALDTAG